MKKGRVFFVRALFLSPRLSKYAIIVSKYAKSLCEGDFCLFILRILFIFAAELRNNITDNNNLKQSDNEKTRARIC